MVTRLPLKLLSVCLFVQILLMMLSVYLSVQILLIMLSVCLFVCLSSETLQLPTLHYVLQLMVSYYENMVVNKRDKQLALAWSQR